MQPRRALSLLCLVLLVGCGSRAPRALPRAHAQEGVAQAPAAGRVAPPSEAEATPEVRRPAPSGTNVRRATLASVGDVLPHLMVKGAARARAQRGADGRTDNHAGFAEVMRGLRGALDAYDVASFNMEAPVVEAPLLPHMRLRFFAPLGLPAALREVGFDLAVCANNHAFDQGAEGLVQSQRNLRSVGLATTGCGPDLATASEPSIHEVNGIRIAVLSFARLLNAFNPARREHPERPQALFWYADEPEGSEVLEAIARTRARSDVDVVVVNAHWDREYQPMPLGETRRLARKLVDAGVDLVVGHHPHILQPAEWLTASDGRRAAVIYSLGNFVSEMCASRAPLDVCDRRLSAISVATFEARDGEPARLADLGFEPAWMDHRAACPGETEPRTGCVRPLVVARELERLRTELASVAPGSPEAEALRREQRGFEVRRDVILRFMGPHPEGDLPRDTFEGHELRVRGRGRNARALEP